MNIVMALLALGFLIFIHELGHFWAARATGVRVDEFAVGFGPSIIKHQRNGVLYRLNWIPLGGYVKMYGEDNPEAAAAPDNFNNRPVGARILVIVAGVIMNIIGAFVILALLFNIYGAPTPNLFVGSVQEGKPGAAAGLLAGDQIKWVEGKELKSPVDFNSAVQKHADTPMEIGVLRDGNRVDLTVTPKMNVEENRPMIGIGLQQQTSFVKAGGFGENTRQALRSTGELTALTFNGFKQLVTGAVSFKEIGGPVEIIRITGQASDNGVPHYMYIVALLSVNLAVLNILPFPALDGGRLVFLLVEWVRRGKRISLEREASINFVGILFLLTLMVVVTFKDVFNIFSN
ncbi:RIP metalloprotease RseP [Tumebacillus algifaecis]|uniref:Zinc metalloprotease n=1 Tax=Tumebacillus algifaecis TaxID=1214604 RepID=A0A223CXY3_9BACL|nr:RIP metalloprotease RseP [Tumebacillus algifaecis]ASS74171.1 RIP metalloprotease RseP [Tumebacillus algifaecis]